MENESKVDHAIPETNVSEEVNAAAIDNDAYKSEPFDPEALLEVRHLRKCFPIKKSLSGKVLQELVAVDDVSFKLFVGAGEEKTFTITPTENGIWTFTSYGEGDSLAELLNSDGESIWFDDDSGYENQFRLVYELEAGQTYTIKVRWWDGSYENVMGLLFTWEPIA